jgi:hypothetical protein
MVPFLICLFFAIREGIGKLVELLQVAAYREKGAFGDSSAGQIQARELTRESPRSAKWNVPSATAVNSAYVRFHRPPPVLLPLCMY